MEDVETVGNRPVVEFVGDAVSLQYTNATLSCLNLTISTHIYRSKRPAFIISSNLNL